MAEAGYVRMIEAAYRAEPSDGAWLSGLLGAAEPLLDLGAGVVALRYETRPAGGIAVREMASSPSLAAIESASRAYLESATGPLIARMFERTDAMFLRREAAGPPSEHPDDFEYWSSRGVDEAFSVVGYDLSGHGVMLSAIAPERARVPGRKLQLLRAVAAHLASAVRLRHAPAPAEADDVDRGGAEALLDGEGTLLEAAPAARGAAAERTLSKAARLLGRARAQRVSDDEALRTWRALWAGRWTLVEREERGGRCYLVARRNEPQLVEPKALTLRERQVLSFAQMGHSQKFIAFELGLAPSTVAGHLASGLRKLGLRDIADLVKLRAVRR